MHSFHKHPPRTFGRTFIICGSRLSFPPSTYLSILSWLLVPKTGQANHINKFKQGTCVQTGNVQYVVLPFAKSPGAPMACRDRRSLCSRYSEQGDSPHWVAACLCVGRNLSASLVPRGLTPSEGTVCQEAFSSTPKSLVPDARDGELFYRTFRQLGERCAGLIHAPAFTPLQS